jgi:transcriptional regulator with XRE-family HTH domain
MTGAEYKAERKKRGTQMQVAALLGVMQSTISDRETGRREITREAELALKSLPVPKGKG